MQKIDKFKSKDDIQYIVGTNVRKLCKEKEVNLMEFAEESAFFEERSSFSYSLSVKITLTPFCASSKLPLTALTKTFAPSWVHICRR